MRVLVFGGRTYVQRDVVYEALDLLHGRVCISILIDGAATGADTLGHEWAVERGAAYERYPIEDGEGGFARNVRMLASGRPQMCVRFPGGRGTRHMALIASQVGVTVIGELTLIGKRSGVNEDEQLSLLS